MKNNYKPSNLEQLMDQFLSQYAQAMADKYHQECGEGPIEIVLEVKGQFQSTDIVQRLP